MALKGLAKILIAFRELTLKAETVKRMDTFCVEQKVGLRLLVRPLVQLHMYEFLGQCLAPALNVLM